MNTMKAVVFKGKERIAVEEVPRPVLAAGEAVIRITTTTICGTDVHIVRGEYPVKPGLILGHEPVGVIEELGRGPRGAYAIGQRVIVGAITPCGQCFYCLNGSHSQCGGALGGWRFGNTINGAWAEYLLVPDARRTSRPFRDGLADEDVLLCPDIFSTGLSRRRERQHQGRRRGRGVRAGPDRPVRDAGREAQRGVAHHRRSTPSPARLDVARRFGANVTLNINDGDPVPDNQAADGRPRRRRRDRSARPAGDVRERAARDSPGRDALEPRRLLGQARRAV